MDVALSPVKLRVAAKDPRLGTAVFFSVVESSSSGFPGVSVDIAVDGGCCCGSSGDDDGGGGGTAGTAVDAFGEFEKKEVLK